MWKKALVGGEWLGRREGYMCDASPHIHLSYVGSGLYLRPLLPPSSSPEGIFSQGSLLCKAGASVFSEISEEEDSAA